MYYATLNQYMIIAYTRKRRGITDIVRHWITNPYNHFPCGKEHVNGRIHVLVSGSCTMKSRKQSGYRINYS